MAIESIYPEAFPDEDLVPVVHDLLQDEPVRISLVALLDGQIVGHVMFTHCSVKGNSTNVALLAPLAVKPGYQRQGIGSALVRKGHQQLGEMNSAKVFVLGDPAYYGRLGFETENNVSPPYELPKQWAGAWQSLSLQTEVEPVVGKLITPSQWLRRELWAP